MWEQHPAQGRQYSQQPQEKGGALVSIRLARMLHMQLCTWSLESIPAVESQQTRQARTLGVDDGDGASVGHRKVAWPQPMVGIVEVEQDLPSAVLQLGVAVLRSRGNQPRRQATHTPGMRCMRLSYTVLTSTA